MELSQLRYFLKAAELKNFTRAAEACFISQPALSQQILKLEEELKQPVFERQGRQVSLTPAGEVLRERAEQILTLVDDVRGRITDDGETGRVAVSAIPTIAPYLLPDVLRCFAERFPKSEIEVNEDVTEALIKRVQQGEVDVGLVALPVEARYLKIETLFEEELLLAMPAGHPLADRKRVTLTDLTGLPFVLLGEAHCLTGNVLSFCQRKAFQPVMTGRTSQLATVQELVALGHGVSLIPASAARLDASDRRTYRSLSGEKPTRTIALCWNSYRFQSRLLKAFLDCVREKLAGSVSDARCD